MKPELLSLGDAKIIKPRPLRPIAAGSWWLVVGREFEIQASKLIRLKLGLLKLKPLRFRFFKLEA